MKKILLGTTGLVGAALLASAASAETPKVTLGGFSDFQAGWTSNDDATGDDSGMAFRNDNEISVRVDGKTDAGLGYGAVIDLEADLTEDNNNEGTNAARTFTYLEGGWGRVELGGNKSAASTMRVDASTVAVATGGINGDWIHFVNDTGTNVLANGGTGFITNSELQSEHGAVDLLDDETTYNSTKVTYYSPRWAGFQFGASYTPDLDAKGQLGQRVEDSFGSVVDLGLGYETQFDGGMKLAASGTYETADNETGAGDDIQGWNVGALLGWEAFSVAGSWGDWSEGAFTTTGITPSAADTDGEYWTAGIGWDGGPFGLSATYMDSELSVGGAADNEFNNLVVGADYKLAPGLTPYAEVSFYEFEGAGGVGDNDGTTVILGTQVAF